jgi:hypothetical protein
VSTALNRVTVLHRHPRADVSLAAGYEAFLLFSVFVVGAKIRGSGYLWGARSLPGL